MSNEPAVDNRRRAYRVRPDSPDELVLDILGERHQLVRGEVADVAVGGARVRVDKHAAPALVSGERVTVAMSSTRYNYQGRMPARIVRTAESDDGHIVHLSFEGQHLAPAPRNGTAAGNNVFSLFNRRTKVRGVAGAAAIPQAMISPNTVGEMALRSYPVAIRNVSNVGVSLVIDGLSNRELAGYDELSLRLQLPDKANPSSIACHVRRRTIQGDSCIYSCEYDWSATSDPLAVVEDLVEYMLEVDNRTPGRGSH